MTLRRGQILGVVVLAVLSLAAAGGLAGITTRLHALADEMVGVTREIRGTSELEMHLRGYYRDPDRRRTFQRQFETALAEAARNVRTEDGRRLLAEVRATADALFAAPAPASFEEAIDSVQSFEEYKFSRLEEMREAAARWNRLADVLGFGVAGFLLLTIGGFLTWTSGSVIRPVLRLHSAMSRYAEGDRSARADETGAADLRAMARAFNDLAAAQIRSRDELFQTLAKIAHDLRNPLTALRLQVDSIRPGRPLPEEAYLREALALVSRQAKRIDRMAKDLLEVSKIQAGGLTLELETADACALVRGIVELARPTTDRHAFDVRVPEREVRLQCDPARLDQVLENLVGNAIKYSPNGGTIVVALEESAEEVRIAVTDPGPGIAPEDRARIFQPFARLPTSKGIPGTGVGLSIAKAIVEAHRGAIEIESPPGAGSTFRIRLPRPTVLPDPRS